MIFFQNQAKKINPQFPVQTEISQPSGQRIMLETQQTSFAALCVYPLIGTYRSASMIDARSFFICRESIQRLDEWPNSVHEGLAFYFISAHHTNDRHKGSYTRGHFI